MKPNRLCCCKLQCLICGASAIDSLIIINESVSDSIMLTLFVYIGIIYLTLFYTGIQIFNYTYINIMNKNTLKKIKNNCMPN